MTLWFRPGTTWIPQPKLCIGLLSLSSLPVLELIARAARQVVEPLDPRIHFALVCGAKSCPPIRVYTPASLEVALEAAAQAFCSSARSSAGQPDLLQSRV